MSTKYEKLFIICSAKDYESFKNHIDSNSLVLAWTEEAAHALESFGASYCTLRDFLTEDFNTESIFKKYAVLAEFVEGVESWIKTKLNDPELFSFRTQVHSVRLPFFLYAYEIDKLRYLLNRIPIRDLYCRGNIGSASLKEVVSYLKPDVRVHAIEETAHSSRTPNWYSENRPLKLLAKMFLGRTRHKTWKSLLSSFFSLNLFFNKKPFALVHSVDWDHDEVLRRLSADYNILFFEDFIWKKQARSKPGINSLVQEVDELSKCLPSYGGIPIYLFMKNEINFFLEHDLFKLEEISRLFKRANQKFQFKFFFTSYYLIETELIHHLLKANKVPSYFMLHGGTSGIIRGSGFTPFSARRGDDSTCHFLLYSDLVKEDVNHVKGILGAPNCHLGIVGDVYFQNLIRKGLREKKVESRCSRKLRVCYIYAGTGPYNALFKWGIMDDASLTAFRYKLLASIEENIHPDVEFTFKFGYKIENNQYALEQRIMNSPSVRFIDSSHKLLESIDEFDIFITELPSTSLLELMALNKKVMCLLDRQTVEVCKEANPEFENAVYPFYGTDEFLSGITRLISLRLRHDVEGLGDRPRDFAKIAIGYDCFQDATYACVEYIKKYS